MKRHKYNAKRVVIDGFKFDSQAEAKRYGELKLLWRAGKITALVLQPRFPIVVNGEKICTYVADFMYETDDGEKIIEDTKGFLTDVYVIKKKLMLAVHGVSIKETR